MKKNRSKFVKREKIDVAKRRTSKLGEMNTIEAHPGNELNSG